MTKRTTLLVLFIIFFRIVSAPAQERPFRFGVYVQAEFGKISNSFTIDYTTLPIYGIGGQIHYQLNDEWTVVSGIGVSRVKYEIEDRELRFGCDFQMQTTSSFNNSVSGYFVDVPLQIKYHPQPDGRLYLTAGAVLETNLSESGESAIVECGRETIIYSENMSLNYFTRFNMDIVVGGGYMILKDNPGIYIQPTIRYGLRPLTIEDITVTNDHLLTYGVTLGLIL